MKMNDWAENEVKIFCGKSKKQSDDESDEISFDYTSACAESALKAYNSLCDDGHSGCSWGITKNILLRLMNNQPLTPITDEDFFIEDKDAVQSLWSDKLLKKHGWKSHIQCPRMSSLFRTELEDGRIIYDDIDRVVFIDIDNPNSWYHTKHDFLDEMFPITMPYVPSVNKFKIYTKTFKYDIDNKHSDFDTRGIFYMITPDGDKIKLNRFYKEVDGKFKRISKIEFLIRQLISKVKLKIEMVGSAVS